MKTLPERLKAKKQDQKLQNLRTEIVGDIKRARRKIGKSYDDWDRHNDVYRGRKPIDQDDVDAQKKGKPKKLVIPLTFAQVNTFVAFAFLLFTQNKRFFEFIARGAEDRAIVNDLEETLERDLIQNRFLTILHQSLLDTARFGVGIIKSWWTIDKQYIEVTTPAQTTEVDGINIESSEVQETKEVTKYEGNRLSNVSPYNFFYDTRFPLSEWRKGSFVADETEFHINDLKDWERDERAHGVEHITPMDSSKYHDRGETRLQAFAKFMDGANRSNHDDQIVCITEAHKRIIPKNYGISDQTHPTPYVITIANDDRIIALKPLGYVHDEWCYDVGLFSPDMHQELAVGLADTIDAMQDIVSYLVNTRLTSVRRSLESNLILDPSKIDMSTVENRSPYILTKKIGHNQSIQNFVQQLQYVDTTAAHFSDADVIMKTINVVTGVNENAMGVVSSGRRSATELRAANGGAAARMKVVAKLLWTEQYAPLGRKMKLNQRQGLSLETFIKILGETAQERYQRFHPPIEQLVGDEDHFTFDSTLESEKGYIAQSLQELLQVMLSSPEIASLLRIDPSKVITEILELRGTDNIERFHYDQQPTTAVPQAQPGVPTGSGPPVGGVPAVPSI